MQVAAPENYILSGFCTRSAEARINVDMATEHVPEEHALVYSDTTCTVRIIKAYYLKIVARERPMTRQ